MAVQGQDRGCKPAPEPAQPLSHNPDTDNNGDDRHEIQSIGLVVLLYLFMIRYYFFAKLDMNKATRAKKVFSFCSVFV